MLVIGLGLLILAGFGVVVATLLHRAFAPGPGAAGQATAAAAVQGEPPGVLLREPDGTGIASVTAAADGTVALLLRGGGETDRVVLLDARAGGRVIARVGLAPTVPPSRR